MKLKSALVFFSRLPIKVENKPDSFDGILAWFPVVGVIIGSLVVCSMGIASFFFPPLLCAFMGCFMWVFLTGGLHLDGVSDCGDGLFVETSKERRLEIMKDSQIGTFGALALFFVLSAKLLALVVLFEDFFIERNVYTFLDLLVICASAGGISRAMNFVALELPSVRAGGLGEFMRKGLTKKDYYSVAFLVFFLCLINGMRGFIIIVFVLFIAFIFLRSAKERIGGVTGDVLGCLTELLECTILIACCLEINPLL